MPLGLTFCRLYVKCRIIRIMPYFAAKPLSEKCPIFDKAPQSLESGGSRHFPKLPPFRYETPPLLRLRRFSRHSRMTSPPFADRDRLIPPVEPPRMGRMGAKLLRLRLIRKMPDFETNIIRTFDTSSNPLSGKCPIFAETIENSPRRRAIGIYWTTKSVQTRNQSATPTIRAGYSVRNFQAQYR